MRRTAAVLAVVIALFSGCGSSDGALGEDPNGREACDQLVRALEHADEVETKVAALMAAAKAAQDAKTQAVVDSLNEPIAGLEDVPTVDIGRLSDACRDAGVDVPDAK